MKLRIRLLMYMLVCFMSIVPVNAYATEVMVPSEPKGSISVTIRDKNGPVAGGNLLVYQVLSVAVEEGEYYFGYTEAFEDCEVVLTELDADKINSGELAASYADYIKEKKIEGQSIAVDESGKAVAENLELGLYLILQNEAAKGYAPINPFLVLIPVIDGDNLIYDVDATPKVGTVTEEPDKPDDNPPSKPPGKLPQTGQLWWPVPILAVVGILFFAIGWKRRSNNS